MGVSPARCWVIEDSVAGVEAAVSANMAAVGFVGGRHCGEDQADRLRAAGAVTILEDLTALPDLIGSLAVAE
jgi:beta-phosphoglucomutase-like phosphatase (HAD superfamily)